MAYEEQEFPMDYDYAAASKPRPRLTSVTEDPEWRSSSRFIPSRGRVRYTITLRNLDRNSRITVEYLILANSYSAAAWKATQKFGEDRVLSIAYTGETRLGK